MNEVMDGLPDEGPETGALSAPLVQRPGPDATLLIRGASLLDPVAGAAHFDVPDAEARALPRSRRNELKPVSADEDLYYNTKYGTPLAYARPLEILAENGLKSVASNDAAPSVRGGYK